MSDESGDASPATDPQGPATDPWGNPLPPGTVQQPPRSQLPPPVPPSPAPGQPPPAAPQPAPPGTPDQAWWPADPQPLSPGTATDAWGQPVGAPSVPSPYGPQPGPPGYPPAPGYGYAPPKNAGKAIGSMVCGIFSLLCAGWVGVVLGPVAIGVGLSAKRRIAASDGQLTGAGFATAGIVLGAIGLVASIASIAFLLANPDFIDDLMRNITTTTSTPS